MTLCFLLLFIYYVPYSDIAVTWKFWVGQMHYGPPYQIFGWAMAQVAHAVAPPMLNTLVNPSMAKVGIKLPPGRSFRCCSVTAGNFGKRLRDFVYKLSTKWQKTFCFSPPTNPIWRRKHGSLSGIWWRWICRTGSSRTGNWRTDCQGWNLQDWSLMDRVSGVEFAGLNFDRPTDNII